jgi:hypothetical protein
MSFVDGDPIPTLRTLRDHRELLHDRRSSAKFSLTRRRRESTLNVISLTF